MPPKRKAKFGDSSGATKKQKKEDEKVAEVNSKKLQRFRWVDIEGSDETANAKMFCYVEEGDETKGRSKVIGFDLDFTLIKPKSGAKFAKGAADWTWLYECVPAKLKELERNYRICIFSNQGGIEKNKVTVKEIMVKTESIISALDIPIYAFYSTGENEYRKPSTTMFDYFVEKCNNGEKVNLNESIYVGDAAGRAKNWAAGKPKDFSCTDRMFAANVGLQFHTPEEFFLNEKPAPFEWRSFDFKKYLSTEKVDDEDEKKYHSKTQEVVVLVGLPASGKSTFTRKYFIPHGYVHVNRDTLSTPAKCLKLAKESVDSGKSIVVDNTNPTASVRSEYLKLAKEKEIPCRCFIFKTPREIAHHLNYVRQNLTNGEVRRIPEVGFNVYAKNFETPTAKEGFNEIQHIPFKPRFENERHERLLKQWT